jgi:hypothetical protein
VLRAGLLSVLPLFLLAGVSPGGLLRGNSAAEELV